MTTPGTSPPRTVSSPWATRRWRTTTRCAPTSSTPTSLAPTAGIDQVVVLAAGLLPFLPAAAAQAMFAAIDEHSGPGSRLAVDVFGMAEGEAAHEHWAQARAEREKRCEEISFGPPSLWNEHAGRPDCAAWFGGRVGRRGRWTATRSPLGSGVPPPRHPPASGRSPTVTSPPRSRPGRHGRRPVLRSRPLLPGDLLGLLTAQPVGYDGCFRRSGRTPP
jgi:hypothetical protein